MIMAKPAHTMPSTRAEKLRGVPSPQQQFYFELPFFFSNKEQLMHQLHMVKYMPHLVESALFLRAQKGCRAHIHICTFFLFFGYQ